jgi:hypothetical protein
MDRQVPSVGTSFVPSLGCVPLDYSVRQNVQSLLTRVRARTDAALAERQRRWQQQPVQVPEQQDDPRAFTPRGIQGVTPVRQPGDDWTQWQVCPGTGGKSGERMSDMARHNPTLRLMQVQFASGGSDGTGNTYEYPGVSQIEFVNFLSGRLGGGQTWPVLDPRSGRQLWWGYKV